MPAELTGRDSDFLRIVLPACAAGRLEDVRAYADDRRAFARWIGPHGRTMVWEAARRGRTDVVCFLADEHDADLHAYGCYYRETRVEVSPWLVATLNEKDETVQALADRGAAPDFFAHCRLGDTDSIARCIASDEGIANRPYVREHRWNGYTAWPLQYAIAGGHLEALELLIDAGADANADRVILYDAVDTGQPAMADRLVAAGAEPAATRLRAWIDDPRYTAIAKTHGHRLGPRDFPQEKWPALVDACRGNHNAPDDPERVRRILKRGADVNVRDDKGKIGLHRAAQAGFVKITKLLLSSGADLESPSSEGDTPIFDAAFYGRVDVLEILAAAGADLEARNDRGETPLFAAVRGGRADAVRALERLGASLEARNTRGHTPADVARRSKKIGIEDVRRALEESDT